jgi:hypothetical protein
VRRIELSVAFLDSTSALVPGNDTTDMVRAGSRARSDNFSLRLAGCQGKHLIAQGWRITLASGTTQS